MTAASREYELVLLGANGYTGRLTAEHITKHFPTDLKWAIAGRSSSKLADLAGYLKDVHSERLQPSVEVAEVKHDDLHALAKKTKVIINMIGPYSLYGEPVVEACASNGTHYLDVTAETPWVQEMISKYHDRAVGTGAIIIPQIGFESAPADVLAWALVSSIRAQHSAGTGQVILSVHDAVGSVSGGTIATILALHEKYGIRRIRESFKPWALSPIPRPEDNDSEGVFRVRTVPELGLLTTSISAMPNRSIVHRSWGLIDGGEFYGPNFRYNEHMRVRNRVFAVLVNIAVGTAFFLLALSPFRWLLQKIVYAPGSGPSLESTKNNHFDYRAIAVPDAGSGSADVSSRRAYGRMAYKGGLYYATGVFASEAAMVLIRGDYTADEALYARKLGGGILTPATLGQPYVDRLVKAGFTIETGWS